MSRKHKRPDSTVGKGMNVSHPIANIYDTTLLTERVCKIFVANTVKKYIVSTVGFVINPVNW